MIVMISVMIVATRMLFVRTGQRVRMVALRRVMLTG
jgi:hypothetical protein